MENEKNEQSTPSAPINNEGVSAGTSRPFFQQKADSPERGSKEENAEEEEECSVCRNEIMDATALSDCTHEFCYDCIVGWLTKGVGPFCPMCKTNVKFIRRKANEEKIAVEEILAKKEPVAVAAENVVTEKRIISRKMRGCRRMNNMIDEIIGASGASRNQARHEELSSLKQLSVSQLNSLQMLQDDINAGAAKGLVVANPAFRRLVYEREVIADGLPNEYPDVTKEEFLNNIEHYRAVIKSFLLNELKAIPVREQPRVGNHRSWSFYTLLDKLKTNDEQMIMNRIFEIYPVSGSWEHSFRKIDSIFENLVSTRTIQKFISELRSLINSKMTYLVWCGTVRYRFETDLGGEAIDQDVVTVDDTVDDEPEAEGRPMLLDDRRRPTLNPLNNLFQALEREVSSHSDHARRRTSSSDTDQDDDIYFQAPLLIPGRTHPTGSNVAAPMAIPRSGLTWAELASGPSIFSTTNRKPPTTTIDATSDDDDIQVLEPDGTIVLDDSSSGPSSSNTNRKRKSTEMVTEAGKRARRNRISAGLIQDIEKLMDKHGLTTNNVMTTLVDATQEVIDRKQAVLSSRMPVLLPLESTPNNN